MFTSLSFLFFRVGVPLIFVATAGSLRAKDAYGNNTPWTNSDNTIRAIQSERARAERPGQWWQSFGNSPAPATYREQQELRRRQAADAQRERDEDEAWERHQRMIERTPPKPVSYREYLERRVLQQSDRAAQEELAFYLVSINEPVAAVSHLEMIVYLKRSPRAGEAAWQLFRIAAPGGAQPDAARAAKYLREAVALRNPDAMFAQAHQWIFGDKKSAVPPDLPRGLALMDEVMRSDSGWHNRKAGDILFQEYALGVHGPVNPAKAIAVARYLRTLTSNGALENSQEDTLVDLLIASPGGWAEHHAEILAAIESNFSALFDPVKSERLVRIYLGFDPETKPYAPLNPKKGAEALRGLARMDPERAKTYLPAILLPGPNHDARGAHAVLDALRDKQPREVLWIRATAELLANAYGDTFPAGSVARYLDNLEKESETPAQLLAVSQFLAVGGQSVPAQPERADRVLQRAVSALRAKLAASRAEHTASYELARLHVLGLGVPRDIPAAIELLKSHGNSDEPPAVLYPHRVLLASIYLAGYGVQRSPREARSLLAYPARQGFVPAQAAYAEMAATWTDDPLDEGDREEAFRYAKAAAASGDTTARLTLAQFYQDGFGTAADPELALTIYTDGANASVPGALVRLALFRFDESGPWHDASAGFAAAQRAADLGDGDGAYLLGRCWEDGLGTTQDNARALQIFEQAARAGHWGSAVATARLLTVNAPPIVPDAKRALAVLEHAAATATNDQQFHFVQLLLGEASLPEDKATAKRWARLAADNGSEDAEWLFRPGQALGPDSDE